MLNLDTHMLIYALTAGGTNDGPRLIALDKDSGEELGSVDLPGGVDAEHRG